MNTLVIAAVIGFAALSVAQNAPDPNYCYAFDSIRPQQPRWSDRTSNEFIRTRPINNQVSSCTPARFGLYMRHADRLPSRNDIDRMGPFAGTVSG